MNPTAPLLDQLHLQHRRLRRLAWDADLAAVRAARGDERWSARLREAAVDLAGALLLHLVWEERSVLPVLAERGVDVERLLGEHEAQRAAAERLRELALEMGIGPLCTAVRTLVVDLDREMRSEEEEARCWAA